MHACRFDDKYVSHTMDSLACYPPYHQGAGQCIVPCVDWNSHSYRSMKLAYLLCFQCEVRLWVYCSFHCKHHSAALWRRRVSYESRDRKQDFIKHAHERDTANDQFRYHLLLAILTAVQATF
jgi:hypothetical protein